MALLIRPEHRHQFSTVLDGVFRLRQRVFVERLGWALPSNDGFREVDVYDDGGCYHLAVLGAQGEVLGTSRITPSLEPNVTCEVLEPQMPGRPFPRGPHIAESSRVCSEPELPPEVRREVGMDLRASSVELRRQMGWTHMIGVGYDGLLQSWVRSGMSIDVVSGPTMFPGDREIALGFVSWEDPARPNALNEFFGARQNALQDPAKDPTLIARFGDRSRA